MKQPKILIDTDNGQEYRNFDFEYSQVQGIYIIDSELMGVIIGGADFILEYNNEVYAFLKHNIAVSNNYTRN